jgi:hypothetical protein
MTAAANISQCNVSPTASVNLCFSFFPLEQREQLGDVLGQLLQLMAR